MDSQKKQMIIRAVCTCLLLLLAFISAAYYYGIIPLPMTGRRDVEETDSETSNNNENNSDEPKPSLNVEDLLKEIIKKPETNIVGVTDTSLIPPGSPSLKLAGILASEGYYTSDLEYNGDDFIIAKMEPNFTVTDKLYLRNKYIKRVSHEQLENYGEFEAVYTDVETIRPAVELYMGYIIVDDGETLSIYNRYGNFLTTFDDAEYIPAYTRDSSGNPLFYRTSTAQSGLFDAERLKVLEKDSDEREDDENRVNLVREPHEKDETVLVEAEIENEGEGNPVYEEVKVFYRLSDDGSYFVQSGYNDISESRGLYFDYPAYYGLSDSAASLSVRLSDTLTQDIDGKMTISHDSLWAYSKNGYVFTEYEFKRAYNFIGGLGCVVTEPYYQDGGLYFVNGNGNRAFGTTRQYLNNMERYVIENLTPPISNGPESIGYFYYDHGLVRVRKEIIDSWNYTYDNLKRYLSSEEILIDTQGREFPVPSGYDIKAYSNGMILLEKDGLFGFMDYTGAWIAEPVYSSANPFSEGLASLTANDGRVGMIDTSGNIVVPFEYQSISSCSDGIIAAYHPEDGWQILRKMTVDK